MFARFRGYLGGAALARPFFARHSERLAHTGVRRLERNFRQITERNVHEFARLNISIRTYIKPVYAAAAASKHLRRLLVNLGRENRRDARLGGIVVALRGACDADGFSMQ